MPAVTKIIVKILLGTLYRLCSYCMKQKDVFLRLKAPAQYYYYSSRSIFVLEESKE